MIVGMRTLWVRCSRMSRLPSCRSCRLAPHMPAGAYGRGRDPQPAVARSWAACI
jgi:hypothetical protein